MDYKTFSIRCRMWSAVDTCFATFVSVRLFLSLHLLRPSLLERLPLVTAAAAVVRIVIEASSIIHAHVLSVMKSSTSITQWPTTKILKYIHWRKKGPFNRDECKLLFQHPKNEQKIYI